jgi:hypothetical protein
MAYARLIFSTSATVQQKLKEITNICVGGITSNTQLEFANTQQSIVITTEPAGWTIADANSAIESAGVATKVQYRLSSPCVNPSKTKYCELGAVTDSLLGPNQGTRTNTRPAADATAGHLWIPIGTGVSANTLTNAIWYYNAWVNTAAGVNYQGVIYDVFLSSSFTEYFVSVTNRKLIVISNGVSYASTTNGPAVIMNLEFPETTHTTMWSNLPFINIFMNDSTRTLGGDTASTNIITGSTNTSVFRSAWLTNWYDMTTGTRAATKADQILAQYYMPNIPSRSITSSGTTVLPLCEFIDIRSSKGEGVHNYSTLTNTYYTYKTPNYVACGDEAVIGSDTYVLITIGGNTSTSYLRTIAIKKA